MKKLYLLLSVLAVFLLSGCYGASDNVAAPETAPSIEDTIDGSALSATIEAGNFFFSPSKLTASPGQTVNITFSKSKGSHTFVFDESNFKNPIKQGNTITFTAPTTPGDYFYYCDISGHRANGMEGVLTVQ